MKTRTILILSLLFALSFRAVGQNHFFRHYSTTEGLPSSFVYTMSQDNNGYLWIGTPDGLFKYNGFEFEHNTIANGLANDFATKIFKDSKGWLWIGHQDGSITLLRDGKFTILNKLSDAPGMVTDFIEDKEGAIWFSTQNQGLHVINNDFRIQPVAFPIEHESLTQIEYVDADLFIIGSQENLYLTKYSSADISMDIILTYDAYPGSKVVEIFPDLDDGFIIVSQEDGIYYLDPDLANESYQFSAIDENSDGELDNMQGGLLDSNGLLWLISMGNGILQYQVNSDKQYIRSEKISTANGLESDDIRSMFEDMEGNMWFGLYGDGLLKYVNNNLKFYNYGLEDQIAGVDALTGNSRNLLIANGHHLLWIDRFSGKIIDTYSLPDKGIGDRVNTIYQANDGKFWLGFEQSGVYILDSLNKEFKSLFISNDQLANSINHITGEDENIWVSTKKGVVKISRRDGSLKWFTTNHGMPHNNIKQLYIDGMGRVLIATLCGEIHFIDENDQIEVRENSALGPFNSIVSFCEDTAGTLWVGTYGNGLWQIGQDTILNFTRNSGLISDFCYGLSLTEDGQPIISHTGGISLINLESFLIRTFSRLEGVKSTSEFYSNAVYNDNHGSVWFGTSEGLIRYNSELSRGGLVPPRIHINSVQVNGAIVDHTTGSILLKPGRHELFVDYIGLNFTNPEMVFYQTRLEGYSREWSDPTFNRSVLFERVEHGTYTFQLKAYNENEISSELLPVLEVIIKRPLYLSFWFYTLIALILGTAFYILLQIRERNHRMVQDRLLKNLDEKTKEVIVKEEIIKERKKVEQVLIEAKTKAELSEKLKTSFLQNMSHEIRTPMNAIVGFSSLLQEEGLSENDRDDYITNVNISAHSLLHLIEDIMDVSKLESNQLTIQEGKCLLNKMIWELGSHFTTILENEGKAQIKLTSIYQADQEVEMITDSARLKQVFMKLLDNAVKFTESGEIRFGYSLEGKNIFFFVEDTGIGLSEDKKDVVFDLFRKIEDDKLKLYGGTGLGLTLARYLVELLGGTLDLESHEGFGSKFFFTLPYLKGTESTHSLGTIAHEDEFSGKFAGKRLLIVEDTDSNFILMERIFSITEIRIERAINGEIALQKFFHEGPFDLVIMDIKLPGMDGYEITRLIKERSPNTPVISHTAYALEGDRNKSLEAGCDEYIPKPTEKKVLLETVSRFL